ncbi:prim-pol domain-containing protein [Auricularia subglabra TFB-10046 SS5]|uniref:DNA primase n=1 Tax=Auricularia subglabra (strain TFB-10046 / SS5) TaxID=717982 RepID=J0D2I6_AURST|nr:prim-pol domain-containing protein [Auricularia subglabra TFB-10046 SS5]
MSEGYDPETMKRFYNQLYPFKSIFRWLNQGDQPTKLFTQREFSATLPGDIYLRYHSFDSADDFKANLARLNPTRFEIGAVYNVRPRERKTLRAGALQPQQREFVLDIDMTDYDNVRTCCAGKGICSRCWGFIAAAVRVLDAALRTQFGFNHLLWVYSGRRGIHCWVSDADAMNLTDDQRRAIMGWLDVFKSAKGMTKRLDVRRNGVLHPAISAASRILNPRTGDPTYTHTFDTLVLQDQDCFKTEERSNTLLELLGHAEVASTLRAKWAARPNRDSSYKWDDVLQEVRKRKDPVLRALCNSLEDIILQYMYPRLDTEVSRRRNHLLKAPFCVHPSTGRVCVPVDPQRVDDFRPEAVPTVNELLAELDRAEGAGVKGACWENTSLAPYVEMLDRHAQGLIQDALLLRKAAEAASLRF